MREQDAQRLVETYSDMIMRLSYTYLKTTADAEDICQTVFLKYLTQSMIFDSEEHEKAWMIRTTINACKDLLKSAYRKKVVAMVVDTDTVYTQETEESEVLEAVMRLPEKYRTAIYLYYYEGYTSKEIAELTGTSQNVVDAHLSRGRKKLKQLLMKTVYREMERAGGYGI
jgi:RNA polymerase sigma-70 factor (ECF subfamily)